LPPGPGPRGAVAKARLEVIDGEVVEEVKGEVVAAS